VHLIARLKFGGFQLLDAQFVNPHLLQFGTKAVKKADYHKLLEPALGQDANFFAFTGDDDAAQVLAAAVG
jgi:leucyl/phenylalanyl-tRNA---protein transferase